MVSAKALMYGDEKTKLLLNTKGEKRPIIVQIFGSNIEAMKTASKYVEDIADIIDINMGCPAPKVVKNGDGSKLLLDVDLAVNIAKEVVNTVSKPVTVKIRKGWDEKHIVYEELGKRLDLIEKDVYKFCFIVDFPMYELSDEGKIDFNHNPFSMPQGGMDALLNSDPLEILAYQYDVVCNGYEMASGAVRNHDPELMVKAFEIAGYSEKEVEARFGALYNAFQYGTPPHAGAAPGLDRMVMLIADSDNIREVIAFPKNKKARDLLMRAPSKVTSKQLEDVHIKVDIHEDK